MSPNPAEIAIGPMTIGLMLNILLYGVMITQVYTYFQTYSKDKWWFKALVGFLFVADTTNAVFDTVFVYNGLVVHWGETDYATKANWVFATDPAMTGIIAACVQFFFAWRILVITRSKLVTVLVAFGTLANLLAAIGTAIAVGIVPVFTEFVKFEVIVIIWLVSAAVTDLVIAIALCYHLQKHKTGFPATDDIVNKIVRLTVQTGVLTATFATIDVILFLVDSTATHLIFNVPLSKLYTNSLMSSLNGRKGWKLGTSGGQASSTGGITAPTATTTNIKLPTTPRQEVFVNVENHELVEIHEKENSGRHLFPDSVSEHNVYDWDDGTSRRSGYKDKHSPV